MVANAVDYELIPYPGDKPEWQGKKVRLYKSDGSIRDTNGRIIDKPDYLKKHEITPENSHALLRKRQEKQAAKLREAIQQAHNANMPDLVHDSAEAFAMSGAMLYEDVVLDPNKYPRDRLETWEKLGKYAGVLPSDIKNSGNNETNVTVSVSGDAVVQLLSMLSGVKSQDADVIDVDS